MELSILGYHRPDDLGPLAHEEYDDETGMVTEYYRSTDRWDYRRIVAKYHDDVGLVTYYREV